MFSREERRAYGFDGSVEGGFRAGLFGAEEAVHDGQVVL